MLFSILTEKQGSGARFLIAAVLFVAVSMLSFLLYQQKVDKKEIRSFLHYASKIIFVLILFDMTYISVLQKKFTAVFDFEILVIVLSLFGFIALQTYLELEPPQLPATPVQSPVTQPPVASPVVCDVCEKTTPCPENQYTKKISLINEYEKDVKYNDIRKFYNSVGFVCGLSDKELYIDLTVTSDVNYLVQIRFKNGTNIFYVSIPNNPKNLDTTSKPAKLTLSNFKIQKKDDSSVISPAIAWVASTSIATVNMEPVVVLGYRNVESHSYVIPIDIDEKISKVHVQLSDNKAISLSLDTTTNSVETTFPDGHSVTDNGNNYLFSVYHETE